MTADEVPTPGSKVVHRFTRIFTDSRSVRIYRASDVREQGVVVDGDTAETVAGVVRLLRRTAERAWIRAKGEGPRSSRQLLALGVDLTAEEVRNLLPDGIDVSGPTPAGHDEAGLLRSAEQLLGTIIGVPVAGDAARLRVRVADLVAEANTHAG